MITEKNVESNRIQYLDHGFVELVDVMGSDEDIVRAARVSTGSHNNIEQGDVERLIRYLLRRRHTSPFEMAVVKFHLKIPIFVMRQHIRHRMSSTSEYSGRYSKMSDEYYTPSLERFKCQDTHNKQGSGEQMDYEVAEHLKQNMIDRFDECHFSYENAIDNGLSKELARIQLPVSNYTELYWKIDLHNFMHYIKLRNAPDHAQAEIVELAQIMYDQVKSSFPITMAAFEDYVMDSMTFSKHEVDLLNQFFDDVFMENPDLVGKIIDEISANTGTRLSKREEVEFVNKVKTIITGL